MARLDTLHQLNHVSRRVQIFGILVLFPLYIRKFTRIFICYMYSVTDASNNTLLFTCFVYFSAIM